MRHFLKIGTIDPTPLLLAISRNPHLWNTDRTRTFHPQTAHRVVDDILLRYNEFSEGDDFVDKVCASVACVSRPALAELAEAIPILINLMARVQCEHLGRVFISRMAPGVCIPPHTDRIAPAEDAFPQRLIPAVYFSRYQIALQASPGVIFRAADEEVFMAPGDVWWFDNCVSHEVINNSAHDRISMVVDVRSLQL